KIRAETPMNAGAALRNRRFLPMNCRTRVAHIPSKIEQFHYPPALIIIALLAAALIFLRIRYRSLWPGILLHMVWNGSGFLLLLWH
ncbi:CPBP family intramembrane metalloprotease, partial [Acidithiobacillus thiooxidans]|uniref:CPBP family glutamic-type intramembrane protease n=1 Tax=Acidithiobacillus thiooxidans TaxID=930 RepID=UPI001C06E10B